jgi:hypothetical protein
MEVGWCAQISGSARLRGGAFCPIHAFSACILPISTDWRMLPGLAFVHDLYLGLLHSLFWAGGGGVHLISLPGDGLFCVPGGSVHSRSGLCSSILHCSFLHLLHVLPLTFPTFCFTSSLLHSGGWKYCT